MSEEIEIHRSGEWSGLYLNGVLKAYGDHYHADEWLYEHFRVRIVEESPWLGADGRTPLRTLKEVREATEEMERRHAEAMRLRAEAQTMIDRANALERGE